MGEGEVELVPLQQNVITEQQPKGRLDEAAAAEALLPLLRRSASSLRHFSAYARLLPVSRRGTGVSGSGRSVNDSREWVRSVGEEQSSDSEPPWVIFACN